ncbi:MAG: hypothetical protein HOK62_07150, partial [Verrucomicrobiales bacterium]|nr:hypothetical protein [Verrucomicrobiales bacterium]
FFTSFSKTGQGPFLVLPEPRSSLGEFLRRHHLTHHAHGHTGNFGVSTPLWDWLLGTRLRG